MLCKHRGRQRDAVLNFNLLWLLDVNNPRLCYVNIEVYSVTPCLTCYGKQRRHFEFLTIWRIRAVCLNLTCYYY